MAKAILTTRAESLYDDLPEFRYHFPHTYLNTIQQAVGDHIIYYEPRRTTPDSDVTGGRQSYYAIAIIDQIIEDKNTANHYYALIKPGSYLEFVSPVPFREDDFYFESSLKKTDGSVNKGSFGRSVRLIPEQEFDLILQRGFSPLKNLERVAEDDLSMVAEETLEYDRPSSLQLIYNKYRDPAFKENVRNAYQSRCAITGLKLINGGGACEIEAAHIMPVSANGPDSVRNGIALSRTVHWMFDRGIISLENNGKILIAGNYVTEDFRRLIRPGSAAFFPQSQFIAPHKRYLEYHRDAVFIG